MPKHHWMPDMMATACYKCEKGFNSFRRRHHCRYCGLLFCTKCTRINLHLAGGVKLDRACDKCFAILAAPQEKIDNRLSQYPHFPKDNSIFIEEDVDDAGTEINNPDTNIDLHNFFYEDGEINIENVRIGEFGNNQELETYLNYVTKDYLGQIEAMDVFEITRDTVRETVRSIRPRKKDSLNLNKYLRVVNFPTENKCQFFNGLVFKKGLANKRMTERFANPRILVLSGSTGFFLGEKKITSMDKVVEQEENFMKIFLELIVNNIKPNLIIVEKSMPFTVIDELTKIGISVILNMKRKFLKLISRLISSKILGSINQAFYQTEGYLGNCTQFWHQRIGADSYIFFQASEESTLCASILINPMSFSKKLFKETIMKLCVLYRSSLLEQALLELFSVKKLNFIDFHSSGSSFIHLSTCRGRICSRPKVHQIEYYSKNGKAIGDFFKYSLTKVLEKCDNFCDKKLFTHVYYYYKIKGRVMISQIRSEIQEPTLMVSRLCLECKKQTEYQELTSLAWKFSFNKFVDNFFREGSIEHDGCSHDFYSKGQFIFAMSNYAILVEYQPNAIYSAAKTIECSSDIIENLLKTTTASLLESGSCLLTDLRMAKDYILNMSTIELNDGTNLDDISNMIKLNKCIEDSFIMTEMIFREIQSVVCENYFEVEALRRNLFLECCKVIIGIENVQDAVNKVKSRKKTNSPGASTTQSPEASVHDFSALPELCDKFDFLSNDAFLHMQQGLLTLPLQNSTICVPVDEEDSLTMITYALSSQEYYKATEDYLYNTDETLEKIENDLLSAKEDHFVFSHSNFDEASFQVESEKETFRKLYGDCVSMKVTAHFYKEFHGMRNYCVGSHLSFLLSISQSKKNYLHLGKSKALFRYSIDEKFMLKIVGERQFRMFLDFAPNYFRHICKGKFHGMPTCLVKILGAYHVQVKNHSTGRQRHEWIFLSENLCYQSPESVLVYDLKGTINRRRKVQEGDERTKMDLNFVEDMGGLPIIMFADDKRNLDAEIWNDTLFLSQQNIVDYSLLLVLDTEKKVLRYGIIDYMEQYTFDRAIESKYKTVVGNEKPTIIFPKEYKNRFRQYLIQIYFMSVD